MLKLECLKTCKNSKRLYCGEVLLKKMTVKQSVLFFETGVSAIYRKDTREKTILKINKEINRGRALNGNPVWEY